MPYGMGGIVAPARVRSTSKSDPSPVPADAAVEPSDGAPGGLPVGQTTTQVKLPSVSLSITRDRAPTGGEIRASDRSRLQQVAIYGGIAALGAFEIVEWPVAIGLGAGAYFVRWITGRTGSRQHAEIASGPDNDHVG